MAFLFLRRVPPQTPPPLLTPRTRTRQDENEEASQQAGITCMPTFQLYKGGAKAETLEGASEAGLRAMLDKHK